MEFTEAAIFSLIGVLLGGGLQLTRDALVRRSEARSVRAALRAILAALLETIDIRGLRSHLETSERLLQELIDDGRAEELVRFPHIPASNDYFGTLDTLMARTGMLRAKEAAAFSRVLHLVKSASEILIYRPGMAMRASPVREMIVSVRREAYMMDLAIEAISALIASHRERPIVRPPGIKANWRAFESLSPTIEPPIR